MIITLALSRLMVNISLEPEHGKSAMGMNSASESDTSSSDESIYFSASDGSQNGLDYGSPGNGNVQAEAKNERHGTDADPPFSENATHPENLMHRDEDLTGNGDSNGFDQKNVESLSDSDSASFTTAPSMPPPLRISTSEDSGLAPAVALPKKDSIHHASSNNRLLHKGKGKEDPVQAALRTAQERNQIRYANGIPRPHKALTLIPPFRGTSTAQATSQALSDSTTNGKTTGVKAQRQPDTPLSPVLSEGSNADGEIVRSLPGTDNVSAAKRWTFSALAPEFFPIRKSTQHGQY